jgi:hypothetical protein
MPRQKCSQGLGLAVLFSLPRPDFATFIYVTNLRDGTLLADDSIHEDTLHLLEIPACRSNAGRPT